MCYGASVQQRRRTSLLRAGLLRVLPGGLRQRHRALGGFHGLDVRRGAIANTTRDTLSNSREPEQVIARRPRIDA